MTFVNVRVCVCMYIVGMYVAWWSTPLFWWRRFQYLMPSFVLHRLLCVIFFLSSFALLFLYWNLNSVPVSSIRYSRKSIQNGYLYGKSKRELIFDNVELASFLHVRILKWVKLRLAYFVTVPNTAHNVKILGNIYFEKF